MEKKDVHNVEELDFVSPKFNPLAALNTEDLVPPFPEISGFNSLSEYEIVVREKRNLPSFTATGRTLPAKEQDGTASKVKPSPITRLEFLEAPYHGPLGMLQQWYWSNALVKVWIRHSAGVRGVCTGKLVAFDKHWNIVLMDVEETFVPYDARNLKRTKKKKIRKSATSDQTLPLHCSDWTPCDQTSSENSQSGDRIEFTASATPPALSENSQLEYRAEFTALATPLASSKSSQSECRTQTTALATSSENSQLEDKAECAILATPPEVSGYKLSYCTELYRKPPSVRVRSVGQLFIRGDNIVLIAKSQSHNT